MAGLNVPRVAHRFVAVDGVRVFYREAGPPDAPTMLLLHGFPSASHQFRRLMDALGGRYRLIAPDYPGFGHSDGPAAASVGGPFAYTFDRLADVIEGFCARLGLDRFVMYVFDFGAPVGFRAARRSRSTWPSTTRPTSHSTRAGRRGCAHTPPTLITWGRGDPFFPEPGARAYLRDIPDAELHLFDTGHFALEENLPEIAPMIATFLERSGCRSPARRRLSGTDMHARPSQTTGAGVGTKRRGARVGRPG